MKTIKKIDDFKYYTGLHPEIRDQFRKGQRPTKFGNKVWATSLIVLEYLKNHAPIDLHGLHTLEIGCGWGILGNYLSKNYDCKVTCSDIDEKVLPIVEMHAKLNQQSITGIQSSFSEFTQENLIGFDLIIGSEVCYSEETALELANLIKRAFASHVKYFIIADPGRPDFHILHKDCQEKYQTDLLKMQGSVNGKATNILLIRNEPLKSVKK